MGKFKNPKNLIPEGETKSRGSFGSSVSLWDGYAVVGDRSSNSVHVFRLEIGNFKYLQTLKPSDFGEPDSGGNFGISVEIKDGYIVIGSDYNHTGSAYAGCVFVYRLELKKFKPLQQIVNPEPHFNDEFGKSVAISDGFIVTGSQWDDNSSIDAII